MRNSPLLASATPVQIKSADEKQYSDDKQLCPDKFSKNPPVKKS